MAKLYIVLLLLFSTLFSFSQSIMLTAEESGRMFHVVKKSPVLKRNLSQYFEYTGDTIYFKYKTKGVLDSIIDYDSIVQIIMLEPSLLQVDDYGLSHESSGLLSELSSKMALYQLYRELKVRNEEKEEGTTNRLYQYYLDTLTLKLPSGVVRRRNGVDMPSKKIMEMMNPNLFFNQRTGTLSAIQTISQPQQKDVINAFNYATRSYLNNKGKEYFSKICAYSPDFKTNMLACGDGSNTDGLLEEREKIYKQKNELGDPVGIGLFTYETTFEAGHKNSQDLVPLASHQIKFDALKSDYTTVHFSLWGFNRPQQTTVAIYREDRMYLLYANKLTKELSPDTTFGKGATLQSIIKQLEGTAIPAVDEDINGKHGIKAQLLKTDTSHGDVIMEILATEMKLTELRNDRYSISMRSNKKKSKKKNKKKKKKKADRNKKNKKFNKAQDHLAWLYSRKNAIEKRQADLELALKEAEETLANFQARLIELKGYIDYREFKHTNFGYIYTFEDGTTFNCNTQNLTFPDSLKTEDFKVRLITFGPDAMSKQLDEIQMLTSVSKGKPEDFDTHNFALEFNDNFKSDQFKIEEFELTEKQQFELAKLLHASYVHEGKLFTQIEGNGIGKFSDGKVVPSIEKEQKHYPGEDKAEQKLSRETSAYKILRTSYATFNIDNNNLFLQINSYTDPVTSHFSRNSSKLKELKKGMDSISDNELLSAFRSFQITEMVTKEIIESAYTNLKDKEKTKVLSNLKQMLQKSKAVIREQAIPYKKYAEIAHPDSDFYELCIEDLEKKEEEKKAKLGIED